jgi:hypothetical protein
MRATIAGESVNPGRTCASSCRPSSSGGGRRAASDPVSRYQTRDNPFQSSLLVVNRVIPSRRASPTQRRSAEALVLMLVLLSACYRYRPEVLTSLQAGQVSLGTRVRLIYRDTRREPVEMDLERLDLPYVSGIVYTRGDAPGDRIQNQLRVDLRDIQTIEVQELDGTMSAVAVVGRPRGAGSPRGGGADELTVAFRQWVRITVSTGAVGNPSVMRGGMGSACFPCNLRR